MKYIIILSFIFISCKNIQNENKDTYIREISTDQNNLTSEEDLDREDIVFNEIRDTPSRDLEDGDGYGDDDGDGYGDNDGDGYDDNDGDGGYSDNDGNDNDSNDDNGGGKDVDIYCDKDIESEDLNDYLLPRNKIALCHVPPGNPDNAHIIIVSINALNAHLHHGHHDHKDYLIGNNLDKETLKEMKRKKISCAKVCQDKDQD